MVGHVLGENRSPLLPLLLLQPLIPLLQPLIPLLQPFLPLLPYVSPSPDGYKNILNYINDSRL
jgi:hypothetical protein